MHVLGQNTDRRMNIELDGIWVPNFGADAGKESQNGR
jgi:hypothetical protein